MYKYTANISLYNALVKNNEELGAKTIKSFALYSLAQ